MTLLARLTDEPDGQVALETPYHSALVAWLKTLPYGVRAWDPDRKRWVISALYIEEVLAALAQFAFQVHDDRASTMLAPVGDDAALWAPIGFPPQLARAFYQLGLNGEAPLQLAEVAFRFWQKHYHPDLGGDGETSARLNDAIATIRSYLKGDDTP